MLNWIRETLGVGEAAVADVPEAWQDRLRKVLSSLDGIADVRNGLARDMAAYVLRGEPVAVLHEIASLPVVAERLHLSGYRYDAYVTGSDRDLYQDFARLPVATALRWARLLEAAASVVRGSAYTMQFANGSHWPEVLIAHAGGISLDAWSSQRARGRNPSLECLESMLTEAGMPADALLVSAFATPVPTGYSWFRRALMVSDLPGYGDALRRHAASIRPLLLAPAVAQRLHVLAMLDPVEGATLDLWATELADLATVNSKQVRALAGPLVCRGGRAMEDALKSLATGGKPEQRVHALRLLRELARHQDDAELENYTATVAGQDKAPSVQALIDEWNAQAGAITAPTGYDYEVPVIDWAQTLTPGLTQAVDELWKGLNQAVERTNQAAREHHARGLTMGRNWPVKLVEPFTAAERKQLLECLAAPEPQRLKVSHYSGYQVLDEALRQFAMNPAVTPVALAKAIDFVNPKNQQSRLEDDLTQSFNAMHRSSGRPTLLELQQILEGLGYPAHAVLRAYCHSWRSLAADWQDDAVWPFFAHHQDDLIELLAQTSAREYYLDRTRLYAAIATLPRPPERIVNALFDLALGIAKTERPAAQAALANLPDKESRIVEALANGKAEVRTIAAQWLSQLRHEPALPALETAVKKERNDVAKGAMLDALQSLGQPVEKYLDRASLQKEAIKALVKGLPKDLAWFPWEALPGVRWADTGEAVANDVLRWMLVQAVKQKSAEPNAVLRKFCAMFDPTDRERFGQFVLEAWMQEDIRPHEPEVALANAQNYAQMMYQQMQQYATYYKDNPNFGKTAEELTAVYLPGYLRQPAGSAIATKGLLAIAAACAAGRAAAPVGRYLKEYYGTRAAQGKALIAMLAWIEHPAATQLMLAVGSRFRTRSFQEEATRQAEALAERKGWTVAELADRTIPTAGFDESGVLELSFGERTFSARLLPDFKVELFNADGKKIAALPEPRMDDDADLARLARQSFSAAKKEIKGIVSQQTDRLYEALCTERDWSFEDWNGYLNQHPVVRKLIQRLVWARVEDGQPVCTFRPLDDGSLTDCDDNEVSIPADARIRIAHDSFLSPELVEQWLQHLTDYEIVPLFQQLGKGNFVLPQDRSRDESIKDFEGYMIEAFALRGRATKLGYQRGATEDAGWFFSYEKRFPTLGVTAVIEFTGNPLPEENRLVALTRLVFVGASENQWQRNGMALNKVPKVLLSECFNDMRLIAADGSGFDADWQKKSEY